MPPGERLLVELDSRYETEDTAARITHGVIASPVSWYRRHRRNEDELAEQEEADEQRRAAGGVEALIDAGLAARLAAYRESKRMAKAAVG